MKLARITVLERHALTFAHTQSNKRVHTGAHTHTGSLATRWGRTDAGAGCSSVGCVFVRERKNSVSFRTRSLSGTGYVMAKWSREGERGQNKT